MYGEGKKRSDMSCADKKNKLLDIYNHSKHNKASKPLAEKKGKELMNAKKWN